MESLLIFIGAIGLSVIFSAFFSAAETALMAVPREKIHQLKLEGSKRAKLVQRLRLDKDRLIGTLLLGNNALNTLASALATSSAIAIFGNDGVVYATIVMTLVLLIFAEILPKSYAFEHPEKTALALSPVLAVLIRLLYPVTSLTQWLVKCSMYMFGIRSGGKNSSAMSGIDALRGAIALHHEEGAMVKQDRDMLGGILDLANTEVGDIMIHRKNMVTVSVDQSPTDVIRQVLDSAHTRVPLWKTDPDNVIGVLHVKDMLALLRSHRGDIAMEDILQVTAPPWFIPNTTLLSDQLHAFRKRRNHFALVVDEYGALMGVVTLEDVLEEIVGHIEDEHDAADIGVRQEEGGRYRIRGDVTIRDLNRMLEWNLPDGNANTIAGLIMYETRTIPEVGQSFHFHGIRCTVLHKLHHQIASVLVEKEPEVAEE